MTIIFSLFIQSMQNIRVLLADWEPKNLDFWISIVIATIIIYLFQEVRKNDNSFHDR